MFRLACFILVALWSGSVEGCAVFYQGACRAGGGSLVQLHSFRKGADPNVVTDDSEVAPLQPLSVTNPGGTGNVRWLSDLAGDPDVGPGVEIVNPGDDSPVSILLGASSKIAARAKASNSFTVEMWVKHLDPTATGPARMFSIARGTTPCGASLQQDFQMGQWNAQVQLRFRSTDAASCASTVENMLGATPEWAHFVFTYDNTLNVRKLYKNGVEVNSVAVAPGSTLTGWYDVAGLALGGATECNPTCVALTDRLFNCRYRWVAFYDAALSAADVQTLAAQPNVAAITVGGTTTRAPTTTVASTTVGSTTMATTAAGGTNAPPPTNPPSGPTCVAPGAPATPHTFFTIVLGVDLPFFQCDQFIPDMAAVLSLDPALLSVYGATQGSSILQVAILDPAQDPAVQSAGQRLENGESLAPLADVRSITDAQGRTYVPPGSSGMPIWIVIVAVVGALLVLAAIIILIVWCHKRKGRGDKRYRQQVASRSKETPLMTSQYGMATFGGDNDSSYNDVDTYDTYDVAAAAAPPPASYVTLRLLQDVTDKGEGILPGRKGDICFAAPSDWDRTEDWLWVRIGSQEGYVPRSYCKL